jgi:hypothetical protein
VNTFKGIRMKIEVLQCKGMLSTDKPKPYWLAVYAPKSELPLSVEDIAGENSLSGTDECLVVFNHEPSKDDLYQMQGSDEVLLVVLKVTP